MSTVKITILHDQSGSFGSAPSQLEEVYSYELPELSARGTETVLEHAFHAFNVGDPETSEVVREYRLRGLRSLSVGDAVRIGDDTYVCKPVGWEKMDA